MKIETLMNPFEHQHLVPKFKPVTPESAADFRTKETRKREENNAPSNLNRHKLFNKRQVGSFAKHPIFEENRKFRIKFETEEKKQENEKLLKSGDIEAITILLQEKDSTNLEFDKEIQKTKEEYGEQLLSATFLDNKDWRILTGLKIFNKETLEHSIGTYLIIRTKIEERLKGLGQEIIHEGVLLDQLYRACLFHDIGKMAIPEFILNSKTTDNDWVMGFMMLPEDQQDELLVKNKIVIPDIIRNNPKEMEDFFEKNMIRAVKFVPIKAVLNEEQIKLLIERGINPEDSLGTIMQAHEKKSEEILKSLGFVIEALLAGNHHNYRYKDEKLGEKQTSYSSMHISIKISSNILHLGDVQHALNGDRPYHHKQPMLRIMTFLINDAKNEITSPTVAALWINDELKKMKDSGYLDEIQNMKAIHQHQNYLQKRHEELLLIDEFLNDNLPYDEILYDSLLEENEELYRHAA